MPKPFLLLLGVALFAACQRGGVTHVDYMDFIQVAGVTYMADSESPGRPLQEGDLGSQYAVIHARLEGSQDSGHRLQDGDAAFLAPGTPVFRLKYYRPTFRLAVRANGRLLLYESDTNPRAKVGSDLLDLADKVQYIGIDSSRDGQELGAIRDPGEVQALVKLLLSAPVAAVGAAHGGRQYFVDFHLQDGTSTVRSYWPESGELFRGILLPPAFASAVTSAVSGMPLPGTALQSAAPGHVVPGLAYGFRLYTHCGADWRTSFDDSFWDLAGPPPSGLGDPFQDGTMTMVGKDQARFDFAAGAGQASVQFHRHGVGTPLKPPAGCD